MRFIMLLVYTKYKVLYSCDDRILGSLLVRVCDELTRGLESAVMMRWCKSQSFFGC
jgi:hypothetical protein